MPEFEGNSQATISGVGITRHLLQLLGDLAYINENIPEDNKKFEYYRQVYSQLSEDEAKLRLNTEILNEEIPVELRDFMCELDAAMKKSNEFFLDSVRMMMEFTGSEDPKLLETAARTIDNGAKMLVKATELNQILKDYLDQQVGQGILQED